MVKKHPKRNTYYTTGEKLSECEFKSKEIKYSDDDLVQDNQKVVQNFNEKIKNKITKPSFPIDKIGERIALTTLVAFGQSKILRRPVIGLMHAIVWWGFLVVTIGTVEIALEGFTGMVKPFSILGPVYDVIMASGEIFATLILIMCTAFLIRRYIMKVKRFEGIEIDNILKASSEEVQGEIRELIPEFESKSFISLLPTTFTIDKNLVKEKQHQPIYGVRYRLVSNYIPFIYGGYNYKFTKNISVDGTISYGGFTKLKSTLGAYVDFPKLKAGIVSTNFIGMFSKLGNGNGLNFYLQTYF